MLSSFKNRHDTHLSLKYLALATAWMDAGTKGNPEMIKIMDQSWYLFSLNFMYVTH